MLFLSGAAALMQESLWTRRLVDLLGASSESTSRVLGSFFLGLALGSAIASVMLPRMRRPWRAAGIAEISVALLTQLILTLPAWSDRLWLALGPDQLASATGSAAKLVLAAGLVGAPATCLGLILPWVIAGLTDRAKVRDTEAVWLYALNTLGGVVGLLCLAWLVLPWLQSDGALLLACALNVIGGSCLIAYDTFGHARNPPTVVVVAKERLSGTLLFTAAWSGCGLLAFEVAGAQLVMLFAPLSYYAPAVLLITVLLMLAAAGVLVAASGSGRALAPVVLAGGAAMACTPMLFQFSVRWFDAAPAATMAGFTLRMVCFALCCLGPALFVAGLIFPRVLAHAASNRMAQAQAIAVLIAVNGVGGFVGAEVMNRWLLPRLGLFVSCGVLAALYVLVAAGLFLHELRPRQLGRSAIALALASLIGLCTWSLFATFPHYNPNLGFQVVAEIFGRDGPIAVVESPDLGRAILLSNQYILGGTIARADQERQAHLPLALHPHPQEVALIGVATGITPGAATLHQGANITAVELSQQVVAAAGEYFAHENHDLARSRARIIIEDGRTYLAACDGRFDVVIGDLFLPWAPGEGRLFSREHFLSVKRALKPGGLFCQWLPMYQLTQTQYELIARTFREAFPDAQLFRGTLGCQQPTLALVGWNGGGLDWRTVQSRSAEIRGREVVSDPAVCSANGIAMLYVAGLAPLQEGPTNTLGNVALELSASRERVTGEPGRKYFYGTRWLAFLQKAEAYQERLPDFVTQMRQLGLSISRWEMSALRSDAVAVEAQRAALVARLPHDLLRDAQQHPAFWPGNAALFTPLPELPGIRAFPSGRQ